MRFQFPMFLSSEGTFCCASKVTILILRRRSDSSVPPVLPEELASTDRIRPAKVLLMRIRRNRHLAYCIMLRQVTGSLLSPVKAWPHNYSKELDRGTKHHPVLAIMLRRKQASVEESLEISHRSPASYQTSLHMPLDLKVIQTACTPA